MAQRRARWEHIPGANLCRMHTMRFAMLRRHAVGLSMQLRLQEMSFWSWRQTGCWRGSVRPRSAKLQRQRQKGARRRHSYCSRRPSPSALCPFQRSLRRRRRRQPAESPQPAEDRAAAREALVLTAVWVSCYLHPAQRVMICYPC